MKTQTFDLRTYEDTKHIQHAVEVLRQQYPDKKIGGDQVPFDNKGNQLHTKDSVQAQLYDYNTKAWISTGNFLVERDNQEFVTAIKFHSITHWAPRNGSVAFETTDGRDCYMNPGDFEDIAEDMVKGWIIGRFKYRKWYGSWGIQCLEVLV